MRNHTDLLNLIAQQIKAQSYLEIGVYNPDHNFNKVEVPLKLSVDPDPKAKASLPITSDLYFAANKGAHKFDLIFIDGLHHADQVKKDIINAWEHLNEGGVIVMHDCNPPTEITTCVPRGSQREWCGDVYKVATAVEHPLKFTVDFDYGCTVLRKITADPADMTDVLQWDQEPVTWQQFDAHREEYLNLVTPDEAKEIIAKW